MWEMIERMASDRLWIYTGIFGSLFGAAFLFWFKDTRMAMWAVAKFDTFPNHLLKNMDGHGYKNQMIYGVNVILVLQKR